MQTPHKILVVDDEPTNIRMIGRILECSGYEWLSCTDPREAMTLCNDPSIALVLLDLYMPHLDGYQVIEQLHSLQRSLPIVVLTSDLTIETRRKALSAGVYAILTTPLDTVEVSLVIRNAISIYGKRG